jgi:hypothetical protein
VPNALPRHLEGREVFASLLRTWLQRSTLSGASFCRATEIALGDNRLHSSQLSGLRVGLQKQISIYTFDAFGALNAAAFNYHVKKIDPANSSLKELLNMIPPVTKADGNQLATCDFASVFLGITSEWDLPDRWLEVNWSETEPPKPPTIEDLGRCVRFVLQSLPGDILDNLDQLVKFYPSKDEARTLRLKSVVMGLDSFAATEAETESLAICVALTAMTEVKFDLQTLLEIEKSPEKLDRVLQL